MSRPAPHPHTLPRPDIQILRAVAVGGVLLYHLWPTRIPGGYVGVDIFFVVSGFLITSHLLSSAARTGTVHLGRFWSRRARRLLPLAGVVLLSTLAAAYLLMPASTWVSTLRNAAAAAIYGQNWLLAHDSVNYLTRDAAPSPTQHFWSLSVEEQFYIVWPLLVLAAVWIATRFARDLDEAARMRRIRRTVFVAIAGVFAASFTASVVLTITDPGLAYFATTTRAWEFAAGGLLAFVVSSGAIAPPREPRGVALRTAGAWAGYAGIVATMLLLPEGAPFPGWVAAIPVAATVLCLAAGEPGHPFAPTVLGRLRPVTYLGDISYGVYLWHWPLIIVIGSVIGPLPAAVKLAVIVASIALAAVSKVLIEDPFRFGRRWSQPWWRGFVPAAVSTGLVLAVTLGGLGVLRAQSTPPPVAAPHDLEAPTSPDEPLVPAVHLRGDDKAEMYDCFDLTHEQAHRCSYGTDDAPTRIAIAGDSHAAMYLPALRAAADEGRWRLDTYVGVSCDGPGTKACAGGDAMAADIIAGDYDLVLATSYRGSTTALGDVEDFWRELRDAGVRLVPIVDVPRVDEAVYRCIDDSRGAPDLAARCVLPLPEAFDVVPDRVGPLARDLGLPVIDPTPRLCGADGCPQVMGNVLLYQDLNAHLTRTAVLALRPWFDAQVDAALAAGARR